MQSRWRRHTRGHAQLGDHRSVRGDGEEERGGDSNSSQSADSSDSAHYGEPGLSAPKRLPRFYLFIYLFSLFYY